MDETEPATPLVAEAPIEWPKPTLEQSSKAEGLIRQAQVLRMRGDTQQVLFVIKEAYTVAPTFPDAIVAYCNELIANNRVGEAMAILDPAHKAIPGNVQVERLFAEMVLRTRFHITDFASLDDLNSSYAANWATAALSAILPGLGHMALLDFARGAIFTGVWVLSLGIAVAIPHGLDGLGALVSSHNRYPLLPIVFLPIIVALVDWIWAIVEVTKRSKQRPKIHIEHPKPPTNDAF